MKARIPIPSTLPDWLEEIARGYNDAKEAVPFAELLGGTVEEKDLFQVAPLVCLKFRGLPKKYRKPATEAALSSYVATESKMQEAFSNPHIAFAFAYLASHYGLDLLGKNEVAEIMDFIIQEEIQLAKKIIGVDRE